MLVGWDTERNRSIEVTEGPLRVFRRVPSQKVGSGVVIDGGG